MVSDGYLGGPRGKGPYLFAVLFGLSWLRAAKLGTRLEGDGNGDLGRLGSRDSGAQRGLHGECASGDREEETRVGSYTGGSLDGQRGWTRVTHQAPLRAPPARRPPDSEPGLTCICE